MQAKRFDCRSERNRKLVYDRVQKAASMCCRCCFFFFLNKIRLSIAINTRFYCLVCVLHN